MYAMKPEEDLPNLPSLFSKFYQSVLLESDSFLPSWKTWLEMLENTGNHQGMMVARAIVYPDRAASSDGHPDGQTLENLYLGPWGPTIRKWLGGAAVARIKEAIDQGDCLEPSEHKNRQGD